MRDLGIDVKGRIQIDVGPSGYVIVRGNMSEENRQKLQEALQNNDEFRLAYSAASSAATLIRASEVFSDFRNAYPVAAVGRYSWLFDRDWDFKLFYERDRVWHEVVDTLG